MTNAIKAEFRKFFTTRMWWGLAIAMFVAGALRVADVTSEVKDDTLLAQTHDLRLIGDVALRAGLPVYELRQATTDLEALFFELTEGTNRNLGEGAAFAAGLELHELAGQDPGLEGLFLQLVGAAETVAS